MTFPLWYDARWGKLQVGVGGDCGKRQNTPVSFLDHIVHIFQKESTI
jgi:hypothetical protein